MRSDKSQHSLADDEVRALDQAVNLLTKQACTVGIQRIKNLSIRLQFNRDITEYTRGIVQDVNNGKKSTEEGLEAINNQRTALVKHTLMDKALLGVGVAAGGMQVVLGGGVCYVSIKLQANRKILYSLYPNRTGLIREQYHRLI